MIRSSRVGGGPQGSLAPEVADEGSTFPQAEAKTVFPNEAGDLPGSNSNNVWKLREGK